MRCSFLLLVCGGLTLAAAIPATAHSLILSSETHLTYDLRNKQVALWSGGALIQVENSGTAYPNLVAFDRSGKIVLSSALAIPDSVRTYVTAVTRSPDGYVAACGSAWTADGRGAGYIAWYSTDGSRQHVIRTNPYFPYLITAGSDGGFWTVGMEMIDLSENKPGVNRNAGVLRHYDQEGKLVSSHVPRSGIESNLLLLTGRMASAVDRIGWLSYVQSTGKGAYMEVTASSVEVATYPLPEFPGFDISRSPAGLAITNSGRTILAFKVARQNGFQFFELDRVARRWTQVPISGDVVLPKGTGILYGADGEDLATGITPDLSMIRFLKLQ